MTNNKICKEKEEATIYEIFECLQRREKMILVLAMRNIDVPFPEMEFASNNDDRVFSFFFLFSLSERVMRKKTTKNKLIFFPSLAYQHTSVDESPLSSMSTKAEEEEEEKASYVSYYACVLCRARQLGNRNNTPTSLSWRRRCPVFFFFSFFLFFTLVCDGV
jgi:hypothetical protein